MIASCPSTCPHFRPDSCDAGDTRVPARHAGQRVLGGGGYQGKLTETQEHQERAERATLWCEMWSERAVGLASRAWAPWLGVGRGRSRDRGEPPLTHNIMRCKLAWWTGVMPLVQGYLMPVTISLLARRTKPAAGSRTAAWALGKRLHRVNSSIGIAYLNCCQLYFTLKLR